MLNRSVVASLLLLSTVACGGPEQPAPQPEPSQLAAAPAEGAGSSESGAASATSSSPLRTRGASKSEIDVESILSSERSTPNPEIDLSAANQRAPALRGARTVLPSPTAAWIDEVGLQVPNPGWQLEKEEGMSFMLSPDEMGAVLFSSFTTLEQGMKKVDAVVAALKLKDAKFSKTFSVTLGESGDVPAIVGVASAVSKDGKPGRLFYALARTGGRENLLAMGGAPDDGGQRAFDAVVAIIANIRRQ